MPRTPGPIRLSFDSGIVELVRTGEVRETLKNSSLQATRFRVET